MGINQAHNPHWSSAFTFGKTWRDLCHVMDEGVVRCFKDLFHVMDEGVVRGFKDLCHLMDEGVVRGFEDHQYFLVCGFYYSFFFFFPKCNIKVGTGVIMNFNTLTHTISHNHQLTNLFALLDP